MAATLALVLLGAVSLTVAYTARRLRQPFVRCEQLQFAGSAASQEVGREVERVQRAERSPRSSSSSPTAVPGGSPNPRACSTPSGLGCGCPRDLSGLREQTEHAGGFLRPRSLERRGISR